MNFVITYKLRATPGAWPITGDLVLPHRACAEQVRDALNERDPTWMFGVRETAAPASHPDAATWLAANGITEVSG